MEALAASTSPLAIVVNVEIASDRIEDFLKVIKIDAEGSLNNENGGILPVELMIACLFNRGGIGCLRFDVLRDQTNPNKFVFYEVYVDADAAARHREYDHFKVWTDFKASGGVLSQTAVKADAFIYK